MARQAKDTVTIPVNGKDTEFNPVYGFEMDSVSKEKLAYLVQLGLKQRTAIAVRKIVGASIPMIETNCKHWDDMIAFGFEATDPKMVKMFADKPRTLAADVAVSDSDIFPKVLDANAVEATPAPVNGASDVPSADVPSAPVVPSADKKKNGGKK